MSHLPYILSLMGMSMLINVEKKSKGGGGPGAPAVLSSASGTATGQTTADLSVATTVTSGTIYWVVSTNGTPPIAAQIVLGRDSTGAAATASGNGTVTVSPFLASATGLSASTAYFAYFVQISAGGTSNVAASSTFTTNSPPGGFTPTYYFLGF